MNYENMMRERINKLEKIINLMSTTLEFYANEKNWEDTNEIYTGEGMIEYSNISTDGGESAQKTLELYKNIIGD